MKVPTSITCKPFDEWVGVDLTFSDDYIKDRSVLDWHLSGVYMSAFSPNALCASADLKGSKS